MYPFSKVEKKWQKHWDEKKTFKTPDESPKPKYYVLDMFPYPSGAGLHVGHPEGYIATDIVSRFKRKTGFNVLHPIGWDAFGLPAEHYALKTNTHPSITTNNNIDNFRRQIKSFGFSYDWDREVNTTDPSYYKWTQWIFLQLYKKGLVYQDEVPVNWCPELKTVLANEEVVNGKSERGGHPVIRKPMRQWVMKITKYADRLLEDLDLIDFPHSIKEMQKNWIGKSSGANVNFLLDEIGEKLKVYTTRPDTLFGATYMVVAPEHPILDNHIPDKYKSAIEAYQIQATTKSEFDRTELAKEKTGEFTGLYAINPVNSNKIPVWISDYVMMTYGTGAIMAVPGHDQRDWEFATKFGIEIIEVISGGDISKEAWTGDGILVNSQILDGLKVNEAKKKIIDWLVENDIGEATTHYKLRDWIFSRQRYWGEPFPLKLDLNGNVAPIDESQLPLTLPEMERFEPSGTGESPLANDQNWISWIDPNDGKRYGYDTNTMPQWAGSCWYYLRYIDPKNDKAAWDSEKEKYWMPVDLYIGGAEHAVLHLLYARFWHKVLYDLDFVSTPEPFKKLINQGMILGEDGEKMSKSRGNVINPDLIIDEYGADAFRLYEMFMGPLERTKPWNTQSIEGITRFLNRVWNLYVDKNGNLKADIKDIEPHNDILTTLHKTIKKVKDDTENIRYNTAIAQLMVFINDMYKQKVKPKVALETFLHLLNPLAPHITEELWQILGNVEELAYLDYPAYEEKYCREDTVTIGVQINGKVRSQLRIAKTASKEEHLEQAKAIKNIQKFLEEKSIVKEIVIPSKIINIVVR